MEYNFASSEDAIAQITEYMLSKDKDLALKYANAEENISNTICDRISTITEFNRVNHNSHTSLDTAEALSCEGELLTTLSKHITDEKKEKHCRDLGAEALELAAEKRNAERHRNIAGDKKRSKTAIVRMLKAAYGITGDMIVRAYELTEDGCDQDVVAIQPYLTAINDLLYLITDYCENIQVTNFIEDYHELDDTLTFYMLIEGREKLRSEQNT